GAGRGSPDARVGEELQQRESLHEAGLSPGVGPSHDDERVRLRELDIARYGGPLLEQEERVEGGVAAARGLQVGGSGELWQADGQAPRARELAKPECSEVEVQVAVHVEEASGLRLDALECAVDQAARNLVLPDAMPEHEKLEPRPHSQEQRNAKR